MSIWTMPATDFLELLAKSGLLEELNFDRPARPDERRCADCSNRARENSERCGKCARERHYHMNNRRLRGDVPDVPCAGGCGVAVPGVRGVPDRWCRPCGAVRKVKYQAQYREKQRLMRGQQEDAA